MEDLFADLSAQLENKNVHPDDAFVAKRNAELGLKKDTFEEPKQSAIQPSKAFDEPNLSKDLLSSMEILDDVALYMDGKAYDDQLERAKEQFEEHLEHRRKLVTPQPLNEDYSLMPQGLKEIQQREGVRDHKLITGRFEWTDDNQSAVRFVEDPKGVFVVANPNEAHHAITSHIDRKFDGKPYYGTGNDIVYMAGADYSEDYKDFKATNYPDGTTRIIQDLPEFNQEPQASLFDDIFNDDTKPTPMLDKALPQSVPNNNMINLDGHTYELDGDKRAIGYTPAVEGSFDGKHTDASKIDDNNIFSTNGNPFELQTKCWIGIDPGKQGGIVALDVNGRILGKTVMPLIGSDIDPKGIYNILKAYKEMYDVTLILEEVHSLHKMAANTNFSMGHTLGIILGIVISSSIKLIRVQPKAWQKEVWINSDLEYLPKTADQTKPSVNTKLTSKKCAYRLFPNADFRKSARASIPHDGICDSVLLAEYGRRKNL